MDSVCNEGPIQTTANKILNKEYLNKKTQNWVNINMRR